MPFLRSAPRRPKPEKSRPEKSGKPKTARDIMLDPHGVYGTRTASRVQGARRRRNVQSGLLLAALMLGGAVWAGSRFWPRAGSVTPTQRVILPSIPASAPVVIEDARGRALLVPLQSGSVWRVPMKRDSRATRVWATGAPASGTAQISGSTLYLPSADGFLRAIDASSGRPLWGTRMPGTPVAQPVTLQLDAPLVIAGDDQGTLLACDARNGHAVWMRALHGPIGNGLSTVALDGGRLGVLVPMLDAPARRGGLICVDARSGAELWRYGLGLGEGHGASQMNAPAVLQGGRGARAFCAGDDGGVAALSPQTGKTAWKAFARAQRNRDLLPGEETPLNGVLLRGAPQTWTGTDGRARVGVGGSDGRLRVYDVGTGRLSWTFGAGAPLLCSVAPFLRPARNGVPARQRLLVAPDAARLWLLDAGNGALLGEFSLDAPACGPPVVEGDAFWVVTREGLVLEFALPE